MPYLALVAKDQLLVHQFLAGLLQDISKQLQATGITNTLSETMERAKLIMVVNHHSQAAAVSTEPVNSNTNDIQQLQQQLTTISEQVAALSVCHTTKHTYPQGWRETRKCFLCNRVGCLQQTCPTHQPDLDSHWCITCNKVGHEWRNCPQKNGQGATVMGSSRPQQH